MEEFIPALIAGITGIAVWCSGNLYIDWNDKAEKNDREQQQQWYDTIKSIGKEDTELLMTGPMLAETDKNGDLVRDNTLAWNPALLMGSKLWFKLQREWYPEKFCKYCDWIKFNGYEGCNEDCTGWVRVKDAERRNEEFDRKEKERLALNATPIEANEETYTDKDGYTWTRERKGNEFLVTLEAGGVSVQALVITYLWAPNRSSIMAAMKHALGEKILQQYEHEL